MSRGQRAPHRESGRLTGQGESCDARRQPWSVPLPVSLDEVTSGSELTVAAAAVGTWLGKLHIAFDEWRRVQHGAVLADDLWQDVLQWYSAFDLSFVQL